MQLIPFRNTKFSNFDIIDVLFPLRFLFRNIFCVIFQNVFLRNFCLRPNYLNEIVNEIVKFICFYQSIFVILTVTYVKNCAFIVNLMIFSSIQFFVPLRLTNEKLREKEKKTHKVNNKRV